MERDGKKKDEEIWCLHAKLAGHGNVDNDKPKGGAKDTGNFSCRVWKAAGATTEHIRVPTSKERAVPKDSDAVEEAPTAKRRQAIEIPSTVIGFITGPDSPKTNTADPETTRAMATAKGKSKEEAKANPEHQQQHPALVLALL